ncbi:MAG TPA: Sec-independent protein translocase TatA, partial [Myxococcales bacterium]|nr:Sec-independent protein translocase TatA [Myxococcales bacterium]
MFGMSGTEIAIVFVLALLLLGPAKLPGLARSLGKGLREFRRATDDLRSSVESEFYRMDAPPPPAGPPFAPAAEAKANAPLTEPNPESVARSGPSAAPALSEPAATAAGDQAVPAETAPTPSEAEPT